MLPQKHYEFYSRLNLFATLTNLAQWTFFIFFFTLSVKAQQLATYEIYDISDGLPSNEVYDVNQDKDGYLWFATDRGAVRFDGLEFETFHIKDGLVDNSIVYIFQDTMERLWFSGLSRKMSILDNGKFIDFDGNDKIEGKNSESYIHGILAESKDRLFFGNAGINELENFLWSEEIVSYDLNGNFQEKHKLWYVDKKTGVALYHVIDGVIIRIYGHAFYHSFGADEKLLEREEQLQLLLQHYGNLLKVIQLIIKENKRSVEPNIRFIYVEDKQFYICTSKGLVYWNQDNAIEDYEWLLYDVNSTRIMKDRENNYWLTTKNAGIFKIANPKIRKLDNFPKIEADHPLSIGAIGPNLLIGTEYAGLYLMNNKMEVRHLGYELLYRWFPEKFDKLELRNYNIDHLGVHKVDRNKAWNRLYFNSKLTIYDLAKMDINMPRWKFGIIAYDEFIAIATSNGLYQIYSPPDFESNKIELDTIFLKEERISDVRSFGDGVLLSSMGKGLYFLRNQNIEKFAHPQWNDAMVNCLYNQGDSVLWVGLNNGLVKANIAKVGEDFEVVETKKITSEDGLSSNFILDMEEFAGKLWITTPKGLMYFSTDSIELKSAPPMIQLRKFLVNGKEIDSKENLNHLQHHENNIKVELSSTCNHRPKLFSFYHYRLMKNQNLIEEGNQNDEEIIFSDLENGTYTLSLLGRNRLELLSEPIELEWKIKPHWSETSIFKSSIICLGGFFFFFLFKWREKNLFKKKLAILQMKDLELRSLRSQMNPHFIYNVLNSIQFYIYQKNTKEATGYLKKFSNLVRSFLEQSKMEFILLNEELYFLDQYISLEKLRFDSQFNFEVVIDDQIDKYSTSIPSLLLQPIVENAIQHGISKDEHQGKILIEIRLLKKRDYVLVSIENSGTPYIPKKNKSKSHEDNIHGLSILEERLKLLKMYYGYSLVSKNIISPSNLGENSGTKVELTLPFKIIS